MVEMKLGVLVFPIVERGHFFPSFTKAIKAPKFKKDTELFMVLPHDFPAFKPRDTLKAFSKVHVLRLREPISYRDEVIVKCNSAMKLIDREFPYIDAVLVTHLECLNKGVIARCFDVYSENLLVAFQCWKEKADGKMEDKPKVHHKLAGSYWWYSAMIPVKGYIEVQGIDEALLAGYGGCDDQFSLAWMNNGKSVAIDPTLMTYHQWHPPATNGTVEEDMKRNWKIVTAYREDESLIRSNIAREWGHAEMSYETSC